MALAGTTTWVDPPADNNNTVSCPRIGGLFKDSEGNTTAWTGFDPDKPILCYSFSRVVTPGATEGDPDVVTEAWIVTTNKFNANNTWVNHKGPMHPGQFRPIGVKYEQKTREQCTKFAGTTFHGIDTKKDTPKLSLATFKSNLCQHMIVNGMFEAFLYQDTVTTTVEYDLFKHHSRATTEQVWEY